MGSNKLITCVKIFGLKGHLLLDIWSNEDVLKIHPLSLGFNPSLDDFHDQLDFQREFFSSWPDGFDIPVGKSIINVGKSLIQDNSQLINLT